jgi:hypothetical protein
MAEGAIARGYEYLGDLRPHAERGRGSRLTADDVLRQGEEIAAANEALAPFRVLRGIECDILRDGSLDLRTPCCPSSTGCRPACTAASACPAKELTARHPGGDAEPLRRCSAIPKGRIINHRPENALDLDQVFRGRARDRRRGLK